MIEFDADSTTASAERQEPRPPALRTFAATGLTSADAT